jgi:methionyl-tRNA synthetase
METVLWTTIEVVRRVTLLCQPYIPGSAAKLLDLLAVPGEARQFAHVHADHALVPGTALPAPEGVFPRYVEKPEAGA